MEDEVFRDDESLELLDSEAVHDPSLGSLQLCAGFHRPDMGTTGLADNSPYQASVAL
ncbi:hypothetical protein [Halostella sp. PRR32]|uniref:hypothetical protein n=1 Tax=Halostella sp. PRR32 TaxID=3098147 RepID=UPI002B1E7BBF|nr:hypothetical protein [Halostella sp. PRR32]